jgi:hypothetical protein
MEQSAILQPEDKIYKANAIWLGAFFGGPYVAGYLIAANFKAFNEAGKAKTTLIYTIAFAIIIFGGILLLPNPDKVPRLAVPFFSTAVAFYLVEHYQNSYINSHIDAGGQTFSLWRILPITLIGFGATILSVLGLTFLLDTLTGSTTKTYGPMQHEIAYKTSNISENEVDEIAAALTAAYFFDEAAKKYAQVKKVRNTYEIFFVCDCVKRSTDFSSQIELRNNVQMFFPNHKIILNLTQDNYDNVVKRLE